GNTVNITDGDSTPDSTDGTSFGNVAQGGAAIMRTFTVKNDGSSTLTLGAPVLPSGFSIVSTDPLVTSLAPGASDTFQVRLDSTVAGTKSGQISITTNDTDENPFNFSVSGAVLPTTASIFNTVGKIGNDGTNIGILDTGMIRVMADFSKAAYSLQSWENNKINDISPNADSAKNEIINVQKWQPLNLAVDLDPTWDLTTTLTGSVPDIGVNWVENTTNKMSNGYYTNGNAAALVARSSDALVISFRGTNDNADQFSPNKNTNDSNNYIHPDKDQWGRPFDDANMEDHYMLFNPLFNAIENLINSNTSGIEKVYVTGHSLGGAIAINYLNEHRGDSRYQGVTFAAPAFTFTTVITNDIKIFPENTKLWQIEIDGDPVPATNIFNRPGDLITFVGDQTEDKPDLHSPLGYFNDDNHSMDYYRQIMDSIDATSWSRILSETGDQSVFIGAASGPNFDPIDKIDRHSPYEAGDPFDTYFIVDGRLSGVNTISNSGDNNLTDPLFSNYGIYYGGRGVDTLTGGGAKELMLGGSGNDKLYGNGDVDRLFGDAGNDTLDGGSGVDTLIGGLGDDTYVVENTGDVITENSGTLAGTKDHVNSYLISYTLPANVENLTLKLPPLGANNNGTGNDLANIITGNALINTLNGAAGNDQLFGKGGKDTLTGGAGADKFVFDTVAGTGNIDTITDFVSGTDKILLDDDIFTMLGITGTLAGVAFTADKFHSGTSALDTLDRIVYNSSTGALYYDANGSSIGQNTQIALIGTSTHPTLAASDFLVIA
ncbi:MAG: choice-of-anchor D domain-containing protein, partial [Nitrosomonas sp.]